MKQTPTTTIAQLLCQGELPLDFARLVGDIDTMLERAGSTGHVVSWGCDEIASFDTQDTRIVLTLSSVEGCNIGGTLTISVGPSMAQGKPAVAINHEVFCSKLVDQILTRVRPRAILWQQINGPMTEDLAMDLLETPVVLPGLFLPDPALAYQGKRGNDPLAHSLERI